MQLVFSGFYVCQIDGANHLTTDTCFSPMCPYWNSAIETILQLVPEIYDLIWDALEFMVNSNISIVLPKVPMYDVLGLH